MLNDKYKNIAYIASWLLAIAALILYFIYTPNQWHILLETPLSLVALLSALVAATWFFVYLQSFISIKSIATPPPFLEYMGVFFIGLLINYSPIRIGIAARALYLSKLHDIKLSVFSAISIFRLFIMLFMSGIIASTALFSINPHFTEKNAFILFLFLGCALLPITAFLSIKLNWWQYFPKKIGKWLTQFGASFSKANNKNQLILAICILVLVQFLLVAIRMKICFNYAGLDISFTALMVVAPLGTILSVLAITPGGIGIREFAVATVAVLLGYSFEQGMQALIIDRISMISVAILLGTGSIPFVSIKPNKKIR